jgi:hypothetical protein
MGLLRGMAEEDKTSGTFKALTEGAVPYEGDEWGMGRSREARVRFGDAT